jgi:hypothetical protein
MGGTCASVDSVASKMSSLIINAAYFTNLSYKAYSLALGVQIQGTCDRKLPLNGYNVGLQCGMNAGVISGCHTKEMKLFKF